MTLESEPKPKQALFLDAMEPEGVWLYTLMGHGHYKIGNQRHLLLPGTVFAIRKPHQGGLVREKSGLPWHYLWIHVTGGEALRLFDYIQHRFGVVHHLPVECEAVRLARDLIFFAQKESHRSAFFWSQKTFLWLHAWWQCADQNQRLVGSVLDDPKHTSRLLSFTPGNMKKFAEQMGYSRSYLSRKLKLQWGHSPGGILRNVRMREAERLVRNTNTPIGEIAQQIGFAAASSFSRAFTVAYHMAPLEYRHSHRRIEHTNGGGSDAC